MSINPDTEIPQDLATELKANGVWEIFLKLSPSHQQEYLNWVNSAKKAETRISRIAKMCEMLQANITTTTPSFVL